MPDIQTEMTKLLNEWNKAEPTITQSVSPNRLITNNVTRITFNFIRDNPGVSSREAVKRLESQGFKPSSTSSLITRFLRGKLVRMENDGLFATTNEYRSVFKATQSKPKLVAKVVKPASVAQVASVHAAPATFDPKHILNSLSLYQARDLYVELKSLFGG